jgi:hypothetical protein
VAVGDQSGPACCRDCVISAPGSTTPSDHGSLSRAKSDLVQARPAFSRAKTSRQDSRLADIHVGPTWLGAKRMPGTVYQYSTDTDRRKRWILTPYHTDSVARGPVPDVSERVPTCKTVSTIRPRAPLSQIEPASTPACCRARFCGRYGERLAISNRCLYNGSRHVIT